MTWHTQKNAGQRSSPDALRQCTRHRAVSIRFMPVSWHYISGRFSIQAPRKQQKSAISAPRPTPKLFKFSQVGGAITDAEFLAMNYSTRASLDHRLALSGSRYARLQS